MVGLGGSAGSLSALQAFFEKMPADTGMVFVIILHLSPEHQSSMAEILARSTVMPVTQAKDGDKVCPNCVYVIPPAKHLIVTDGVLLLEDLEPQHGRRVAVDLFFRSLADSHGPHSVAVVLSGGDGDGAVGIKRIKERGGLTIAQDPEEAQHPGMPQAAIATGMVDWVLEATQMPGRLVEYQSNEPRLLPPEEGPHPMRPPDNPSAPADSELRDILHFLRSKTGREFSYYKRGTIIRRISRRMQVNGVENIASYLLYMRTHSGEAGALLQDFLISVTNFFRDREAFEALEKQIPRLFEGKTASDSVRVWVPACATGEEAYSIAMLLLEHAGTLEAPPHVQVFGCDLDDSAIHAARTGLYPAVIAADVSSDRLKRFFMKEGQHYRMRREIRETVLFASHDLLKDAPFSRIDLVSCRNLLIYLNRHAQQRALDIFHFALRNEGLLFLGTSESVDNSYQSFEILDKKFRLYVRRGAFRNGLAHGIVAPIHPELLNIPRSTPTSVVPARPSPMSAPWQSPGVSLTPGQENRTPAALHSQFLERFAPPSLIVNHAGDIIHLSESAGRFLQHTGGEPTASLLRQVNAMLRIELRAAMFRANESQSPVDVRAVPAEIGGSSHLVDILVAPAADIAEGYMLITFSSRPAAFGEHGAAPVPEDEPAVRHLERELEKVRFVLRETIEQYEAGTEELKAGNEELQAMNEELRAATEELETGREELHSINEELTTVNQELKMKVDELAHANGDLFNLMAATAIATVFLDRNLKIMRYTPPAVELFNLIPGDVGRPLNHLKHQLDYPQLNADAERVLAELSPLEREVCASNGRWFLARVLPYRTLEDYIGGVVLTFVDITHRKRAEEALAGSQERLRLVIENAREYAIFTMDLERRVTSWNAGAERILGHSESSIMGQTADVIFTPEDRAAGAPAKEAETAVKEGRAADERWHMRNDGSRFWGSGAMMAMHDTVGRLVGLLKIMRDKTEPAVVE